MDKIANWLKAYIDAHPIDLGDSDCTTVLDQLYLNIISKAEINRTGITKGKIERI